MAQSNFEERIDTYEIESTNVMTGDRDRSRYLYYQLKMSMAKAKQIDIIVSFLMESGVRMLLNDMKRALDRGVKIRILTGNYLGITQPSALYLIKSELGGRVDLRLYNETSRSFHPKSYIFHYESSNEIYIGSSNISKSALTSGIEWNYRFSDTLDKKNYELFYATFEDLFLNHSIIIDDQLLVHSMQYIGNIVACGQFSDEIDTQKLISEMELSEELYPILGHVFMYEDKYKWYEDLDKMMRKFVDGGVES